MDMKGQLPETVKSGDVIEVQICPIGEFNNLSEDGWQHQLCDKQALKHVAEMFEEPILVDFDHASEDGEHTESHILQVVDEIERFKIEAGRFSQKGNAAQERETDGGKKGIYVQHHVILLTS